MAETLAPELQEKKIETNGSDPLAEYANKVDADREAAKIAANAAKNGGEQVPKTLQEATNLVSGKKEDKTQEQIASEQKQTEAAQKIAEITTQKEAIEKDLQLTREQKEEATKKLESVSKEKDWFDEEITNAPAESKPTDESKGKEIEQKLKTLEQKEAEYNAILEDDFLKTMVSMRKANKDPKDIINEMKGVDADSLPMEQLYEMKLRKTVRLTDEDKAENKTLEDVIKEEMEEFKGFSRAKKARETDDIRNSIKQDEDQRFSKLRTENEQKVRQNTEWRTKAIDSVNTFVESVKNKNYFGVQMTPSIVEKVNEMVSGGLSKSFYNEDGSYNAKFAFEQATWAVPEVRKLIMENTKKKYLAQGKEEALLELQRADGNFRVTKTLPSKPELGKNPTAAEVARASGFPIPG